MTAKWLVPLGLIALTSDSLLAQAVPADRPPRPRWVRLSIAYGPFGSTIQAVVIPPTRDPGSYIPGPPPAFNGDLPGPGANDDSKRPNPPPPPPRERTRPPARPTDTRDKSSPPAFDLTPNATVRPPGYSVEMAVDARTLEEFSNAFAKGNQEVMRDLYANNRVVEVKAPLRVVYLNQVQDLVYVRVSEGPFAGKVYVIQAQHVVADRPGGLSSRPRNAR
jgi:hypothetical protein